MFNEITHQYSEYKNKELFWLGSDLSDVYFNNVKTNRSQLNEYDWLGKVFTYKFNSHGFRSDEFSHEDSVMFLGCSFTVGIGLPLEDTWAYQVAEKLNLKRFNLAIGGSGPDTAFRLANHYIPQIKPKLVVFLNPPEGRFTLINDNYNFFEFSINILENSIFACPPIFRKYYEHWISLEENITLNSIKHKLAIQALCQEHDIKFVYIDSSELKFLDLARDLNHAGIHSNKILAEIILNKINKIN
jgi:hypothetical protein